AVHEANGSVFAHIYAEGYPRESSRKQTQEQILDVDYELAYYRRNSDPRFYKGVEYADVIEALTRRRAADLFAANGVKPENLYVNVQPLSGGPANSEVYTALLQPGDTIMGLKLSDGGHLSHGAPVNRSGKIYRSVSYIVDPKMEALNYEAIEALALKEKPAIIVAGFSAYPLIIDWQRFRDIADKVGALMLADISHISGLVAAGVHPSPIGIADVVMTTTHKSLCGPRGAMIMTHKRVIGRKIDSAVFPGEQGGPHINTMAALAVALKLAATDQFRDLQFRIAHNAKRLAQRLADNGLRVAFGGSENHLLLVDCKSIRVDGVPLTGDMVSRILDVANIVLNRNNIPGDRSALNPFGVRIGTVWASQRGFGDAEIDKLGDAIATIFKGCTPFYYRGSKGKLFRAKVSATALAEARTAVAELVGAAIETTTDTAISIRGAKAARFLHAALTNNVLAMVQGDVAHTHVFGFGVDSNAVVEKRAGDYVVYFNTSAEATAAAQWFADLSDGYVDFGNLHGKLPGPVVVKTISANAPATAQGDAIASDKPFFVGMENVPGGDALPAFTWQAPVSTGMKTTALHARHIELGAKMVDFGGYDMPVWYSGVSEEHAAVRETAGLFDVSHMGVFEASGAHAVEFLATVTANDPY
ncbi:MAG TPA: serine hydroxymethyltransferase, partial [Anaerolineae bacterium]|nr:serine hydroxymethyltransferase [Anaerolineae bacterium]